MGTHANSRLLAVLSILLCPLGAHAGLPLETETARLLKAGALKVESSVEYQTSPEGFEVDVPLAFEYGITDYLELLVEPTVFSNIRPEIGRKVHGVGDLEITLSWLFFEERPLIPALALAGEVKVPTASDVAIGTGETDYSPFLIASKRFGKWDTHLNFGYAILGEPPGVSLNDIFTYAAAAEYHVTPRWDLVAEVVGNTSSSPTTTQPTAQPPDAPGAGEGGGEGPGNPGSENTLVPEAAGNEIVGLVGARFRVLPNLIISAGLAYDNNHALLFRPGVTYRFDDIPALFRGHRL